MKRPSNRMETPSIPEEIPLNREETPTKTEGEQLQKRGVPCKWCHTVARHEVRKVYPGGRRKRFCAHCHREFETREVIDFDL